MGAQTPSAPGADDQVQNICGLSYSHAYAILAAFQMTDSSNVTYNMFLMRNPWGYEKFYNQSWNYNDSRWTSDMIA